MAKINVLDKSVYNRISAGEVVENPASVVKELVENSIDAGADNITVSIENGGIKSITVTDNGCGMEKDDLHLAILPHATSKIKTADDLDTVGTLGFRGEALASITSVSEVTVKSKYAESEVGHVLTVKGGEITAENVCGMATGTQISVRSLFFNTPARYKFLKTSKGEENTVTALMAELIFANPFVAFGYYCDGEEIFKTYGEGLSECIYSVYGDIAENMIPLSFEDNGYKITGYTARPATEAIKSNRTKQTFIVNGRVITDATISAVIQNAYGEFLMKRTFPSIVLDIVMPFDLVDVNVHPNKREVRFADPKKIHGIIYHCVKNAVEKDEEERQKNMFSALHSINIGETVVKNEQNTEILSEHIDNEEDTYLPFEPIRKQPVKVSVHETFPLSGNFDFTKTDITKLVFADSGNRQETIFEEEENAEEISQNKYSQSQQKRPYKVIGQLFDTYLLIELNDKVIFVDQHAAHERILFDKLVEQAKQNLAVQSLLIPYKYNIEENDVSFFTENEKNFEKLGFEISVDGNTVHIHSVPAILTNLNIGMFLSEIEAYKTEFKELTDSAVIKDKIAKYACKNAIKGGDSLTESQIEAVLDYFFEHGVPLQCPHGRPTMIQFGKSEIEKFFGRKV